MVEWESFRNSFFFFSPIWSSLVRGLWFPYLVAETFHLPSLTSPFWQGHLLVNWHNMPPPNRAKEKPKQYNNTAPAQSHLNFPSPPPTERGLGWLTVWFIVWTKPYFISRSFLGVSGWIGRCTQWKRFLRAIFVTMHPREAAAPSSWPTSPVPSQVRAQPGENIGKDFPSSPSWLHLLIRLPRMERQPGFPLTFRLWAAFLQPRNRKLTAEVWTLDNIKIGLRLPASTHIYLYLCPNHISLPDICIFISTPSMKGSVLGDKMQNHFGQWIQMLRKRKVGKTCTERNNAQGMERGCFLETEAISEDL